MDKNFVGFVSPGSAEADNGCGEKLDSQLCQKYGCQKLLKSANPSSSYDRKCPGCFFQDTVHIKMVHLPMVTHLSTNLAQHRVTFII